jgi:hypothetical protein
MNLRSITLYLVIITSAIDLNAQSNTMYYLRGVPQSYQLNPATQPQCRFFIGIPVLNSIYFETYNSSFNITDVIWKDPESNLVIHPFHPNANLDQFLDRFGENNEYSFDFALSPVSFGFGIKEMYFTFDITTKLDQGFNYPGDFLTLLIRGNRDGATYNFDALGFHSIGYIEYALGISRTFSDLLQVGIRPKLLTGFMNISSTDNDVSLYTDHEIWQLDSRLNLQICAPGFIIPVDEDGVFDPSGEIKFDSTLSTFSDFRKLALKNKGFGVDLGAHYKPIEGLTLSASLIDLGFIRWKKYIHTATLEGSLTWEGIEYEIGEDTSQFLDYLLDTIKSNFNVSGSDDPFSTGLNPKLFLGGTYALTRSLDVGLLSRFDFQSSGTKANVIIHANWHPGTAFGLSASYSPFGGRASTFGLGLVFRAGPISFYTVADYRAFRYNLYKYEEIPVFISPANRSRFNTRFGFNLVFGSNKRKRLMKDKPMYYSSDNL